MRWLLTAVLAAGLISPAAASAAIRHATPAGGAPSGACAVSSPCTLEFAISGASAGDTVSLARGEYALAANLDVLAAGLTIQGTPGAVRPQLAFATDRRLTVFGADVTVRDLEVTGQSTMTSLVGVNGGTTGAVFERVVIRQNATNWQGFTAWSVTLRDSVLSNGGGSPAATLGGGSVVGCTFINQGTAPALVLSTSFLPLGASGAATVRNTLLRGGSPTLDAVVFDEDGPGGRSVSLDVGHSAYRSGGIVAVGPDATFTGDGAAGSNLAAAPLLVSLTGTPDIHQLAGSPTIDAGSTVAGMGTLDIDGDVRSVGAAPDIGADEYAPAPALTTGTATTSVAQAGARDSSPPIVSGVALRGIARARRPATLRFTISEAARVAVSVERLAAGRRLARRCVLSARRGRACVKAIRLGRVAASVGAGRQTIRVPAVRLPRVGRYRLSIVATDAAGNRSVTRRLAIRVRAAPPRR